MPAIGRVRQAEEIAETLLTRIQSGHDVDGRLPSETELAAQFGVSRVTVREALSALERRGLVIRKQGLGTFINRRTAGIQTPLEECIEYSDLIQRSGYESGLSFLDWQTDVAAPDAAERLLLPVGDPVLTIRKVFTADGTPVIYCVNTVPLGLIPPARRDETLEQIVPKLSIFTLLARWFNEHVEYQVADVTACEADAEAAERLDCRPGSALLSIIDVGYNDRQRPVFLGKAYYVPGRIHFSLVRKPIYVVQDLP
jgi:GntR family transcriptional regulator